MLSFVRKHPHRLVIVFLLCSMIGLSSYYFYFQWLQKKQLLPEEAQTTGQDVKSKTTTKTNLVQKISYLKCGDEEIFTAKITDNLAGLNFNQLQNAYTGWSINKFDSDTVEMSLKMDSFCREHANNMYIGLKDGYVAVFYGKPGNKPIVKEVTKIPVKKLHPQDYDELRHGMIVHSKEELLSILEGIQ